MQDEEDELMVQLSEARKLWHDASYNLAIWEAKMDFDAMCEADFARLLEKIRGRLRESESRVRAAREDLDRAARHGEALQQMIDLRRGEREALRGRA